MANQGTKAAQRRYLSLLIPDGMELTPSVKKAVDEIYSKGVTVVKGHRGSHFRNTYLFDISGPVIAILEYNDVSWKRIGDTHSVTWSLGTDFQHVYSVLEVPFLRMFHHG